MSGPLERVLLRLIEAAGWVAFWGNGEVVRGKSPRPRFAWARAQCSPARARALNAIAAYLGSDRSGSTE
jgi:hypothetical protein